MAQQPAAQQKDQKKDQQKEQPKPAPQAAPGPPTERRQYNYTYDLNGRPVQGGNANVREERLGKGPNAPVERGEYLRDAEGRPVTMRSTQERVLSQSDGNQSSERVIQRYDAMGRPTRKQLVKSEKRTMPDGSVVSTEVIYDQDVNGRMQFAERRTTTEKKTDAGGNATTVVERPAINGAVQVVERVDRTETKRGEAVTEAVSSRKLLDVNGRLIERDREESVATKTGDTVTKEGKQWQLGATGHMDFVARSVGRTTERPDGSQVEDAEVYATRIAGITPDLNLPQVPTLEQQIHREKKVQANGKIIETTTARSRQVADPTRLGALSVTEEVVTPTAEGKTIQRTLSERDANGKMVRVRAEVEEEKK